MQKKVLFGKLARRWLAVIIVAVVVTAIMVGSVIVSLSKNEISAHDRMHLESLVGLMSDELETQYKLMLGCWLKLSSNPIFRYEFVKKSAYNEIEMLQALSKLSGYSMLTDEYFVFYKDEDCVYRSSGTKCNTRVYANLLRDNVDGALLYDRLSAAQTFTAFNTGDSETVFFAYPFSFASNSGIADRQGLICFVIRSSSIKERFDILTGGLGGKVTVYFGADRLFASGTEAGKLEIVSNSPGGRFTVNWSGNEADVIDNALHLTRFDVFKLLVSAVMLVVIGCLVSFILYRPILKIILKHTDAAGARIDEIKEIDNAFSLLKAERNCAQEMILWQYSLIKRQYLKIVLEGGPKAAELLTQTFAGITLPGPYWMIAAVKGLDGLNDDIVQSVDSLTEDGEFYCFCLTDDTELGIILISLPEREAADSVPPLIREKLSQLTKCEISYSPVLDKPERIAAEYRKLIEGSDEGEQASAELAETIVKYIKDHFADDQLSLTMLADEFKLSTRYISVLVKQATGKSYKDYLTGIRMENAKTLLCESGLSLNEVAQKVGYNNVALFKKTYNEKINHE